MTGRGVQRDSTEDEDLLKVKEFLGGDDRAFEFLFDKYREKVYRIAYRFLHDKEDALEVTQEVFLRAYQGLRGFKTDSKFFTWLYRITVNRAIDLARSRKPRRGLELSRADENNETLADRLPDPTGSTPADFLLRKELAEKLFQAVEGLSPKHKAVFVLHAIEDLSYKEIAEVVGCSIGTVMSRLFYARKKLKGLLVEYGECGKVTP